jgi:hypothetical protein
METRRVYAVVLAVLFLLAPVYTLAPDAGEAALLTGGAIIFLLIGVYIARGNDDEKEDTDSWKPIPSWQYGGRFAELGGLTRDEQEKAVQEVQRKAEEMDTEKNS